MLLVKITLILKRAKLSDLNVSNSEDETDKNSHIEETYGPGIENETEFTSNIDENDSLIGEFEDNISCFLG